MSAGFLARWSQRKRAAARTPEPLPAPAPIVDVTVPAAIPDPTLDTAPSAVDAAQAAAGTPAALPPLEELTLASDFSAFLKEEVSESLRRQALKKLFADPHFNRMDGLDIYIDDYSVADPIPPDVLRRLGHAREWLFDQEVSAPVESERMDAATERAEALPAATEPDLDKAAAPASATEASAPRSPDLPDPGIGAADSGRD